MNGQRVQCQICPKTCEIGDGQSGDCGARINRGGRLIATTFERPCALHVDPIEKKPLFHFLPGTRAFSIAAAGCILHCKNCQNWEISQAKPLDIDTRILKCSDVVRLAIESGSKSIAYTYTDPVAFYEYALETSEAAREAGVRNILVTSAYINAGPLRRLAKVTDAANVDLKFIDDGLYRSICGGSLKPVQDALVILREEGVWVEITNLLIPTLNDDEASVRRLCRWILDALGPDVPVHFSRFRPMYRLRHLPETPEASLERARRVAMEMGVRYCFIGNVWGAEGEHTVCPRDGTLLVRRVGYTILENNLTREGKCPKCGENIPGRWAS